jgi:hypothetical protein
MKKNNILDEKLIDLRTREGKAVNKDYTKVKQKLNQLSKWHERNKYTFGAGVVGGALVAGLAGKGLGLESKEHLGPASKFERKLEKTDAAKTLNTWLGKYQKHLKRVQEKPKALGYGAAAGALVGAGLLALNAGDGSEVAQQLTGPEFRDSYFKFEALDNPYNPLNKVGEAGAKVADKINDMGGPERAAKKVYRKVARTVTKAYRRVTEEDLVNALADDSLPHAELKDIIKGRLDEFLDRKINERKMEMSLNLINLSEGKWHIITNEGRIMFSGAASAIRKILSHYSHKPSKLVGFHAVHSDKLKVGKRVSSDELKTIMKQNRKQEKNIWTAKDDED